MVLELRRWKPYWGPRSLVLELARRQVAPVPSESAVYRCLARSGAHRSQPAPPPAAELEALGARPADGAVADGRGGRLLLAGGTTARALTGVDDHSRFCVSARLMPRERTQLVCDGFSAALRSYGVPEQVLTDNGKVFTGRYAQPPVEVLFDRICRENGVEHLLTRPRTPTTTGKIERFHRTLRVGVRHPPGLPQPAGRPGGAGRVGRLLQHRPAPPVARRRHAGEPLPGDRGGHPGRGPARNAPATTGSRAGSPPTASSPSATSRSASASTTAAAPATCWSALTCSSSGWAMSPEHGCPNHPW